jgi:peptidoglycan hydrolase CwlO-like protein
VTAIAEALSDCLSSLYEARTDNQTLQRHISNLDETLNEYVVKIKTLEDTINKIENDYEKVIRELRLQL